MNLGALDIAVQTVRDRDIATLDLAVEVAITAYLAAAEAPGQDPVAVKPLEWSIHPYYWDVETPFGRYGAWESESNPSLSYWKAPDDVVRREVNGDLTAAKAAAQKHFDKSVLALLVPAPPTCADAEAKGFEGIAPDDVTIMHSYINQNYRVSVFNLPSLDRARAVAAAIRSLASPAPKGET